MRRDRDPHADWTSPQKRKPQKPPRAAPKPRPQDVARAQEAGRAEFVRRFRVSRETMERLDRYVALLTAWQDRINLVAPSTIGDVWMRHIADSIVLDRVLPPFEKSVDLGSGAGLPGLVIAACRPESAVDLVESNAKKAAFLRTAQREIGVAGTVAASRIEDCGALLAGADLVTARALASLNDLLGFVAPHLSDSARCFFPKGRNHEQEITEAAAHWRFSMVKHESGLDDGSVILEIGDIAPR